MRQGSDSVIVANTAAARNVKPGKMGQRGEAPRNDAQGIAVGADLAKRSKLREPIRERRQIVIREVEHSKVLQIPYRCGQLFKSQPAQI